MKEFFNGPYFFPVMAVLLLLLFVVIVWTTISGKKKDKKLAQEEEAKKVTEEIVTTTPTAKDIEEVRKEIEAKQAVVEETKEETVTVAEEIKQEESIPVEEVKKEIAPDAPVIDIPINSMDESEITVEKTEKVVEEVEPQIEVPKPADRVVETNTESETIEVEFSKPLDATLDVGEKIEVPVTEELNETPEEQIEVEKTTMLEEQKEETIELPEEKQIRLPEEKEEVSNAFASIPTEDTSINEDIVVEEPKEYTGEKTEIFDFPDFSDVPGVKDEEPVELTTEEKIALMADEYIEQKMGRSR